MTWGRLCDTLHGHQKAHEAGLEAMGLWTMCASWSGQQLSDGYVPAYIVAMYGGARGEELATRLVEARAGHEHGLWEVVESGGWRFHDWSGNGNPSRVEVLAERERWAQKKRRQRGDGVVSLGESLGVSPGDSRMDSPGESRGVSTGESRKGKDSSTEELVPSRTPGGTPGGSPWGTGSQAGDTSKPSKPRWCGYCDEKTRLVEDPLKTTEDKTVLTRCPVCHPDVAAKWSNAAYAKGIPEPVPDHQRAANHDADEDTDGGALRARLAAKREDINPR